MKLKLTIATALALTTLFYACEDDDTSVSSPEIEILELGADNDSIATIGDEFHIEIDVVAEGTIDYIQVQIHSEFDQEEEWELDTTYTDDYNGLKNTTFHEHVDIDSNAEAGEYHFDFTVTDLEGNQTSAEADITLIEEE